MFDGLGDGSATPCPTSEPFAARFVPGVAEPSPAAFLRLRLRLRFFFVAWGEAVSDVVSDATSRETVSGTALVPASEGGVAGESVGDGLELVSLKGGLLFRGGHTPSVSASPVRPQRCDDFLGFSLAKVPSPSLERRLSRQPGWATDRFLVNFGVLRRRLREDGVAHVSGDDSARRNLNLSVFCAGVARQDERCIDSEGVRAVDIRRQRVSDH